MYSLVQTKWRLTKDWNNFHIGTKLVFHLWDTGVNEKVTRQNDPRLRLDDGRWSIFMQRLLIVCSDEVWQMLKVLNSLSDNLVDRRLGATAQSKPSSWLCGCFCVHGTVSVTGWSVVLIQCAVCLLQCLRLMFCQITYNKCIGIQYRSVVPNPRAVRYWATQKE